MKLICQPPAAKPNKHFSPQLGNLTPFADASFFTDADLEKATTMAKAGGGQCTVLGMGGPANLARLASFAGAKVRVVDALDTAKQAAQTAQPGTIVIASKSGKTTETRYFADLFWDQFGGKTPFCVATQQGSPLHEWAAQREVPAFFVPTDVDGRFSAFGAFGALPMALGGGDAQSFLAAGRAEIANARENSPQSLGLQLASALSDSVTSACPLLIFGWGRHLAQNALPIFRQLFAESWAKNGRGAWPMLAEGTADQHSVLQMMLDGPPCFPVLFLPPAPAGAATGDAKAAALLHEHASAVANYLAKMGKPHLIIAPEANAAPAQQAAELAAAAMTCTAAIAQQMGLSPFGQPAVEAVKRQMSHLKNA